MQTFSRAILSHSRRSLRTYCTAAETTQAAEAPTQNRIIEKNLTQVASALPDRGVGQKFTRLLWIRNGYENSYWTISKCVEKRKGRLRFYGRKTWKGIQEDRERPVLTHQKKGWTQFGVIQQDLSTDHSISDNSNIHNEAPTAKDG